MKMSIPKKIRAVSISVPGPILHGSVTQVWIQCGKKNCCCHGPKTEMLHGPYLQWTGIANGKRTTKLLSKEIAQECIRRIERYKLLLEKLEQLKNIAINNAPWVEHPP